MANKQGDFIWYELMTTDPTGAKAFYESFLPWQMEAEGNLMPNGSRYREIKVGSGHAGGVLELTAEMQQGGARPAWIGYIAVDDVDADGRCRALSDV